MRLHRTVGLRPRRLGAATIVAAGTLLIAGCSAPGGGGGVVTCPTTGQGDLAVTLTAPAGITPVLRITGPGGYQVDLNASQNLTNLDAGTYVLEVLRAAEAPAGGALVGAAYGVNGNPVTSVCVRDGQATTASRTYVLQAGSQRLWVANEIGGTLAGFAAADLLAGGTHAAAARLDLTGSTLNTTDGFALAFDPHGVLWVSDTTGNNVTGQLLAYFQDELAGSGAPAPDVQIESAAFDRLGQIAFDADGNLWILSENGDQILEYTAAQVRQLLLGADGSKVTTAPAYAYDGTVLVEPKALAFDDAGNLWVVASDPTMGVGEVRILRYDAAGLGSGGTLTPGLDIRGTNTGPLIGYSGLAFDLTGNLWVVKNGLRRYDAVDLTATGEHSDILPGYETTSVGNSPQSVTVALDANVDAWVGELQTGLDRFLTTTNTAQTNRVTSSDLNYAESLAFYPSPLGAFLPLR